MNDGSDDDRYMDEKEMARLVKQYHKAESIDWVEKTDKLFVSCHEIEIDLESTISYI